MKNLRSSLLPSSLPFQFNLGKNFVVLVNDVSLSNFPLFHPQLRIQIRVFCSDPVLKKLRYSFLFPSFPPFPFNSGKNVFVKYFPPTVEDLDPSILVGSGSGF